MLTLITEWGIVVNPTRIYIRRDWNNNCNAARIHVWPITTPQGANVDDMNAYPITDEMPVSDARVLYEKIADQVAAGVTVIDLRKEAKEE